MAEVTDDPKLPAAYAFLARTGARSVQLRYQDDDVPVVWLAVAEYGQLDGKVVPPTLGGSPYYEIAAAVAPLQALLRLCEQVTDGAQCAHCKRPTGFVPDDLRTMPLNALVCWYQYDPGAARYIRGCTT